jgi:hypothetical protein
MSFDWHSYLEFAEIVYTTVSDFPSSEAVYRSVASRSYYAVFCAARDLIKEKDHKEFYTDDHKALQNHLKAHRHRVRQRAGKRLHELHQLRLRADYDSILHQQARALAQQALERAKRIEEDLAEIRGTPKTR